MKKWHLSLVFISLIAGSIFCFGAGESSSANNEPYLIACQTDVTGHFRVYYANIMDGFRLYEQTLNERGGINGHPLEVIYDDNKSNGAQCAALTKKEIEEGAILIVGYGISGSQPPGYAEVKKAEVPLLTWNVCVAMTAPPTPERWIFTMGENMHPKFTSAGYAQAEMAVQLVGKGAKVATCIYDTPGGRAYNDVLVKHLKELGCAVVYEKLFPPGTIDFTPWATEIAKRNPGLYCFGLGQETMQPIYRGLEKVGWEGMCLWEWIMDRVLGDVVRKVGSQKLRAGTCGFSRFVSKDEPIAEIERVREAAEKYGTTFEFSSHHLEGWVAGMMVEDVLSRAGWPATRAKVRDALETLSLDTKGLTGPEKWSFSPTNHFGSNMWHVARWNDGANRFEEEVSWKALDLEAMKMQ